MNNIKLQILFFLKTLLFYLILITCGFILFLIPPLSQDVSYHIFADKRLFLNVASNLFFLLLSLLGLALLARKKLSLTNLAEKILILLFFSALFFVGLGSAYYHLEPHHFTLVFDRIPIAIAFTSFFAFLLTQRIHKRIGILLAPILILSSVAAVIYWYESEMTGFGDLRPYILAQAIPLIALPLICTLFPKRRFRDRYLLLAFTSYLLAFYCELYDHNFFHLTRQHISGHTLKHLFGALSALFLLFYLIFSRKE